VIVVAFNSARDLGGCLSSVLADAGELAEVIVVDNRSADGSGDLVARSFPQVRLIRSETNVGFGAGCNLGAEAATGDLLVFLNPDTEVDPGWLEALVEAWLDDPRVGACMSKLVMFSEPDVLNSAGGGMHYLGFGWPARCGERDDVNGAAYDVAFASGAAMLISKQLFEAVGRFDPEFFMYCEDVDLSWRVRMAGYRVVCVPRSVVRHKYKFAPTPGKLYQLERNRLLMILQNYQATTLAVLLPAIAAAEAALLAYFTCQGLGGAKMRAILSALRHLPTVVAKRRRLRRTRTVSDSALVPLLSPRLETDLLGGAPLLRLANHISGAYWKLARPLIRTLAGHAREEVPA